LILTAIISDSTAVKIPYSNDPINKQEHKHKNALPPPGFLSVTIFQNKRAMMALISLT
jgi:hypothetical protein